MITFLTIFFVLIGLNTLIMVFSLISVNKQARKSFPKVSKSSGSIIYPINLLTTELKKAV